MKTGTLSKTLLAVALPGVLLVFTFFSPCALHSKSSIIDAYTSGNEKKAIRVFSEMPAAEQKESDAVTAFAVGRSYYNLKNYKKATLWLQKAADENTKLQDHALYYAGKALEEAGDIDTASEYYFRLTSLYPASVYAKSGTAAAIRLAAQQKKYPLIREIGFAKATNAASKSQQGHNLNRLGTALAELGEKEEARRVYFAVLDLGLYGKVTAKALLALRDLADDFEKLSGNKQIAVIRGQIRAGADSRARDYLDDLGKLDPRGRREVTVIKGWLARRKKEWDRAERHFSELIDSPASRYRALANLFYISSSRKQYKKAFSQAKLAARADKKKAYELFLHLCKKTAPDSKNAWEYCFHAAKLYPDKSVFSRKLLRVLAHYYNTKQYKKVISVGQDMLNLNLYDARKAGVLYFIGAALAKSGKENLAEAWFYKSVLADPLGYYHYRCFSERRLSYLDKLPFSMDKASLQKLSSYYYLGDRKLRVAIRQELGKRWSREKLSRTKIQDFDLEALQLPGSSFHRERVKFFINHRLFHEAYSEAMAAIPRKKRSLPRFQLWLGVLAHRGHQNNRSIYWLRHYLRKQGWGKEMAIVEKLFPGTVFSYSYPRKFQDLIFKYAKKRKLPPLFVFSLIRQESGFAHRVVSWAGAVGLMQVMPATGGPIAKRLDIEKMNLKDPVQNVRIGCSFLGWLWKNNHDYPSVLIGYNAGPARIRRWKRSFRRKYPAYSEAGFVEYVPILQTRHYIKVVLSNFMVYRFLFD